MIFVASRVACVPGGTGGILGAKSTVSWSPLVFSVVRVGGFAVLASLCKRSLQAVLASSLQAVCKQRCKASRVSCHSELCHSKLQQAESCSLQCSRHWVLSLLLCTVERGDLRK